MAINITFDSKDFVGKIGGLPEKVRQLNHRALVAVGEEIGRLGTFEVPHDTGRLQSSYSSEVVSLGEEIIVGYNKEYAAYQHEGRRADGSHVILNYQKGRKGKYLEDPIKNNLIVFGRFFERILGGLFV